MKLDDKLLCDAIEFYRQTPDGQYDLNVVVPTLKAYKDQAKALTEAQRWINILNSKLENAKGWWKHYEEESGQNYQQAKIYERRLDDVRKAHNESCFCEEAQDRIKKLELYMQDMRDYILIEEDGILVANKHNIITRIKAITQQALSRDKDKGE